jgi:transcriptional regulator with XRE-family HTH domain
MIDVPDLGARIRRERKRAGLTLAQLSQSTGLSKAYLVKLETDRNSNPSLDVLRRIADVLDVTIADLIGSPKVRFAAEEARIPPSLRAFAEEHSLSTRQVETLASIRWRKGDEPRTSERWRYILDSLRASKTLDDSNG